MGNGGDFRSTCSPKRGFHSVFNRKKRFPVTHTAQFFQIRQERGGRFISGNQPRKRILDSRWTFQGAEKRIHHRQIGSLETASEIIHPVGRAVLHEPIEHPHRILHIEIVPQNAGFLRILFRLRKCRHSCCDNLPVERVNTGGLFSSDIFLPSVNLSNPEYVPKRGLSILPPRPHHETVWVEIRIGQLHRLVKGIQQRNGVLGGHRPQFLYKLITKHRQRSVRNPFVTINHPLHLPIMGRQESKELIRVRKQNHCGSRDCSIPYIGIPQLCSHPTAQKAICTYYDNHLETNCRKNKKKRTSMCPFFFNYEKVSVNQNSQRSLSNFRRFSVILSDSIRWSRELAI